MDTNNRWSSRVTFGQEQGKLGHFEYGEDIFPFIVLMGLESVDKFTQARIGTEYNTMLEITLHNGYILPILGNKDELIAEFARIIAARTGNDPLVDMSNLQRSVDPWAVDPRYVVEIRTECVDLTRKQPIWLKMVYDGKKTQDEIVLRRKCVGDTLYDGHLYGGQYFADEIRKALTAVGWKAGNPQPRVSSINP